MDQAIEFILQSPIANLFIVAGLAFLGIAVVGNISGKIQPDTNGRILSGLLGCVLIGGGLWLYSHTSSGSPSLQPAEISTSAPSITPETSPLISWAVDPAGVCRDDVGGYPRWSEYTWSLSQCQEACKNNSNCQGFAMSKQSDYCQLFGSDGGLEASDPGRPGAQITHGDSSQPQYTCYIKKR
jgi:hypothetical protein